VTAHDGQSCLRAATLGQVYVGPTGVAAGQTFDLVLSSPLTRALDNCRLVGVGGPVQITDDLRDWD
jgi:hypothetical protein